VVEKVSPYSAIILLWTVIGTVLLAMFWPGGRGLRLARQIFAVSVLAFREGVRHKVLWTVSVLALIPCAIAYYSDADGTHVGRACLILNYGLSSGEVLGAFLIVLLCALSVAREIESRIMHTFGTKPIPRWAILVGKALGFWAIDLLFILGLTVLTAALVRTVPARGETRKGSTAASSGTWADLRRRALTTRQFHMADGEAGPSPAYKLIEPGVSRQWVFALDPTERRDEPLAVRFLISSSSGFAAHVPDVGFDVSCDGTSAPLLSRAETVAQDRPFDFFVEPERLANATRLMVTVTASKKGQFPPTLMATAQLGVPVDDFSQNMVKAFLLMALQGWTLAMITASWSGVLSFPVTVALGLILVLGGEMSRQALMLMESGAARAEALGLTVGEPAWQKAVAAQLALVLQLLPDFRVMGGPTAFVEGEIFSGWVLAQAALMMGVVRVLGWSLFGMWLFQRREVGR